MRRWLEQLAPDLRESDAELLHMWGYSLIVSEPVRAIAALDRAASQYHQTGLFDRELRALADLTALLFLQGHPPNVAASCIRAIRAANRVRDAWSRGATLVGVAAILYTKGRYIAALRVARQASGQPLSPSWRWLLAMLVASINNQLGLPADTLVAIDEALQLPQVDRDDRLRQNLLSHRAMALYERGQIAESIAIALDSHRYLGDYYRDGSAGFSARQLALLLVLQDRVDEAITYLAQARAAFHDMGALARNRR